jgi:hypothetical protein
MLYLLHLVFSVLALWVASRAKPLGTMPYHWRTWVGMETAWLAVVLVISGIATRAGAGLVLTVLYTLAATAAVAGSGIL